MAEMVAADTNDNEKKLPYWQVNVPECEQTAACPDFLVAISDKDRGILSTRDSDYTRDTWIEVQQKVQENLIHQFQRVPSDLRRYLAYNWKLKKEYGSVMNFILSERLHWEEPIIARGRPFQTSSDMKILWNDWPYGIDERIVHLVIWTKFKLEEDQTSGELTEVAKREVDAFIRETFLPHVRPENIVWFKNTPVLKSIHAVEHLHVMLFDPDPGFVEEITQGDIPLFQKTHTFVHTMLNLANITMKAGNSQIASSWLVKARAGEPCAVVRLRNLQSSVQGPQDAWGRPFKRQPILVSAEFSFGKPFEAASSDDMVGSDTLHYGHLSKEIVAALDGVVPGQSSAVNAESQDEALSLRRILDKLWATLTGLRIDGTSAEAPRGQSPLVDITKLRFMAITLSLPKASLLGEAVSLTASSSFVEEAQGPPQHMFGHCLRIQRIRYPTLIGVNSNERNARQVVVADIEIDRFDYAMDIYQGVESTIVKALEASSFETLEALASYLAEHISAFLRARDVQPGFKVRIALEKPTAVTFAEAPVVEILAGGRDNIEKDSSPSA